jgi:DNA-binding NarL/FixJ family response regulator
VAAAVIRLLIADDQRLVRGGFRMILEAQDDIEVVGEAADGLEVIDLARRLEPDVVLMDIRMPALDGIQATKRLLAKPVSRPRVIMLTTFDLDEYVYEAMRAGASGFLLKTAPPDQLARAVRAVVAGDSLLAPEITRRLLDSFVRRPPPGAGPQGLEELTKRELEVLSLVAYGLSNAEIAHRLYVSDTTVKTHVAHVFAKLDVRDRAQAVIAAYESGLVQAGAR